MSVVGLSKIKQKSAINNQILVLTYKEYVAVQIVADSKDSVKIKEKLKTCMDPLNMEGQLLRFANVVRRTISSGAVNIHLTLGQSR